MSRWRFFYHIVWTTKTRLPLIGDTEDIAIRRSIQSTSDDLGFVPHAIGIMPDHVHFAVSIPPTITVAEAIRRLKGATSHAVNEVRGMRHPRFRWQDGYGALTFGEGSLKRVITYVTHQREHHASQTRWGSLETTEDMKSAAADLQK